MAFKKKSHFNSSAFGKLKNHNQLWGSPSAFPDLESLTAGLYSVFRSQKPFGRLTVRRREPFVQVSTFPSEVISCCLPDGSLARILCKYSAGRNYSGNGHRGGVPYEALVYERILSRIHLPSVRCYGAYADRRNGWTWLLLEFLEDGRRVNTTTSGMVAAAAWIGAFHAEWDKAGPETVPEWVKRYTAPYYLQWASRTLNFARQRGRAQAWLAALCARFANEVQTLCGARQTLIHGEYYPKNVLASGAQVYPVDWESAALAAGEIDLATLTEAWPHEVTERCVQAYTAARWPEGPPLGFLGVLAAARLYLDFRWQGDRTHGGGKWYLHRLATAARRLGIEAPEDEENRSPADAHRGLRECNDD
jgi:hypothetical protein